MIGKKIMIFSIIFLMFIGTFSVNGLNLNKINLENSDNESLILTITVDYVTNNPDDATYLRNYEDFDVYPAVDPEWYYIISVSDGVGTYVEKTKTNPDSEKTWSEDVVTNFKGMTTLRLDINIELWDDDVALDDQADISATNEATFECEYDVSKNKVNAYHEEDYETDGEWIYICGEFDNSDEDGEKDAEMKFKITDNWDPMSGTLSIKEELNNNNAIPGQSYTFIGEAEGGIPPYTWRLWPAGYTGYNDPEFTEETDGAKCTFPKYSFESTVNGHIEPTIIVQDSSGINTEKTITINIVVNNRPVAKKPKVERMGIWWEVTTDSYDPDGNNLQYKWEVDNSVIVDENGEKWSSTHSLLLENKPEKIRVNVRDDPPGLPNTQFDDGLESGWSDAWERSRSKIIDCHLFIRLLEKFPLLDLIMKI
jgi:hypothetical protein